MNIDSGKIKKLRLEKNCSQEQLSEKSGLSLRTIQRIEGGSNVSLESIRVLAAAFEVDPNDLMIQERVEPKNPLDSVKNSLMDFADFTGKATRYEYWWFLLFMILVMAIATIIHEKAYQIVAVVFLVPFLAVGTRRLNDTGRSGWWQLFLFVPFGQIVVFYMMNETDIDKKSS
jgi:transcriptional regulator with XRE-family HTH domain